MDLELAGRVAVVTGASEGIGKAIALAFASEGVRLVLIARSKRQLEAVATEVAGFGLGADVLALPTDIRQTDQVNGAAVSAAQRFGMVHIIVNNAGNRMRPGRQIAWTDDEWWRDVDTKLFGSLRTIRAFEPLLPADGSGRVINISGVAGSMVWDTAMTHAINNSAMNQMTRYLAADMAPRGITVNSLVPGLIATEWRQAWAATAAAASGQTTEEFLDSVCSQKGVLLRRWAQPSEVADAAIFLASARAGYITGTTFLVDGGLTANARVAS